MVQWVRVTYIVLRLDVRPPIQEEGDGGIPTIEGSPMEGGSSILQQTDRHWLEIQDSPAMPFIGKFRLLHGMYACMYVCTVYDPTWT